MISIDGQVVTNITEAEQAIKKIKHIGAEWAKLKSKSVAKGFRPTTSLTI